MEKLILWKKKYGYGAFANSNMDALMRYVIVTLNYTLAATCICVYTCFVGLSAEDGSIVCSLHYNKQRRRRMASPPKSVLKIRNISLDMKQRNVKSKTLKFA